MIWTILLDEIIEWRERILEKYTFIMKNIVGNEIILILSLILSDYQILYTIYVLFFYLINGGKIEEKI